jgi:hypothetical protein
MKYLQQANKLLLFLPLLAVVVIIAAIIIATRTTESTPPQDFSGTDLSNVDIQVTSRLVEVKSNGDGTYNITYQYEIKNNSNVAVKSVQASSNLAANFSPHPYSIVSKSADGLAINANYNGDSNAKLLSGNDIMQAGEVNYIQIVVKFNPEGSTGPFNNSVDVTAVADVPAKTSTSSKSTSSKTPSTSTSKTTTSKSSTSKTSTTSKPSTTSTTSKTTTSKTSTSKSSSASSSATVPLPTTVPPANVVVSDNSSVAFTLTSESYIVEASNGSQLVRTGINANLAVMMGTMLIVVPLFLSKVKRYV